MAKYEGWRNRQTWNVALWINNEYPLYIAAVAFMKSYKGRSPYVSFIKSAGLESERTPDNIAYLSTRLSLKELNSMMYELRG